MPLEAAPQVGERVRERPWPFIPGASRTFALAPHSSYSLASCATRPRTVPSTVRPRRGSAYCTRPPTSRPKPVSASPQSCRSPTSSVGVRVRPSGHVKPRLPSRTTRSRCAAPSAPTIPAVSSTLVCVKHGIRARRQFKAAGLRRRKQHPSAPDRTHEKVRIGLQDLRVGQSSPPCHPSRSRPSPRGLAGPSRHTAHRDECS